MKEMSSALEEAKADISALWAIQYLIDKGALPKSLERPLYTTFLASCFRSIRFGINEAHGKGIAIQLNYLLDQGGFAVRPNGTFTVNPAKVKDGVAALTREIMTMQALGDYAKAKALAEKLGVVRPPVQKADRGPDRHRADLHDRAAVDERHGASRARRAGSASFSSLGGDHFDQRRSKAGERSKASIERRDDSMSAARESQQVRVIELFVSLQRCRQILEGVAHVGIVGPELMRRLSAAHVEQRQRFGRRQRVGRDGGIGNGPEKTELGQRGCGPLRVQPSGGPSVGGRMVLMIWPVQRRQHIDVEQRGLHGNSSSTRSTSAAVTVGDPLGSRTTAKPLR
jgi:hypothetical protein